MHRRQSKNYAKLFSTAGCRLAKAFIAVLIVNLCVASIPRCDLLLSTIFTQTETQAGSIEQLPECHGDEDESSAADRTRLGLHHHCACALLAYLSLELPTLILPLAFMPQLSRAWQLNFAVDQRALEFPRAPEPPYPKV